AHLDDRRREQLKHFYKELDKNLRPAEEIYIFGPGQAKKELANYLKGDKSLKAALKGIEGADKKLTRAQKAEQVREFFALPRQPI
ncbi:MAG: hypothetical protein KGZ25_10430, partial [Planctomycetes bacterium]|nr:hypothetical protein [Planctomycetota bacterium]